MVTLKMVDRRRPPSSKRYWLTPPALMKQLQDEFAFDFDACPHPRPEGFDGLKAPWGQSTWVNPPFRKANWPAWIRKALVEREIGKMSVLAMPIVAARPINLLMRAGGVDFRGPLHIAWLEVEDGSTNPTDNWMPCILAIVHRKDA